ncbi:MAG: PAS domain-containing protein [candidate division KSB1 bacterium]|nr:PAS domain-containing protein [candidate division KSB1 bacterium]
MSQKAALQELLPFIRILILDQDAAGAEKAKLFLTAKGFPHVECSRSVAEAWERLATYDILILDPWQIDTALSAPDFLQSVVEAYGDDQDIILWTDRPVHPLEVEAKFGVITLAKSLSLDVLLSWIRHSAKRIWLERIIDNIPDELILIDPRPETFGRIHFANKAKRERFEQGKPLLYDYCWRRFERQNEGDRPCERCISRNTLKEKHSVRTFWDYTDWQGRKESVDLHAVPISDRTGEIRGIIETCRDRTQLHIAQQYIQRIEAAHAWNARLDLFLEGFQELGYPQARFYRRINKNGRDVFQGIRQVGMQIPFDITRFEIDAETDMPTQILLNERFPVLFVIKPNTGYVWEASKVYAHLYRVDERLVPYNDIFKKKRWVEIPVTANGELFAKVSADPVYNTRYISNYELEVLSYYASWAGQALANVERQEKLRLTSETNELIIQINQQISKRPVHRGWLFRSLERVCDVLHASSCSIFLLEGEGANRRLVRKSNFVRDRYGRNVEKKIGPESYKIGQFLVGNVFKSGRNLIENNLIGLAERCRSHSPKQMNLAAYDEFCRHIGEPVRNALFVVLRSEGRKIGVVVGMLNWRWARDMHNAMVAQDDSLVGQAGDRFSARRGGLYGWV